MPLCQLSGTTFALLSFGTTQIVVDGQLPGPH
jgi:hypothetical protein